MADGTLNLRNHTLRKWLSRSSRGVKPFLDQLFGPSLRRGKDSIGCSVVRGKERRARVCLWAPKPWMDGKDFGSGWRTMERRTENPSTPMCPHEGGDAGNMVLDGAIWGGSCLRCEVLGSLSLGRWPHNEEPCPCAPWKCASLVLSVKRRVAGSLVLINLTQCLHRAALDWATTTAT
jgi:hypothetical protein